MAWIKTQNITGPQGPAGPFAKPLTANLDLYVATTGSDVSGDGSAANPWATPHRAMRHLLDFLIAPEARVTIHVADGTYLFAQPLELGHPSGKQITITGGSVSGSKPQGSELTGGQVNGHTAESLAFNAALLTAHYNTIWQFNGPGLTCASGDGITIDQVLIRGDGSGVGVASTGGTVRLGSGYTGEVAVHNFDIGISTDRGRVTANLITVTNCVTGLSAAGGSLQADHGVVSNCGTGIRAQGGSSTASSMVVQYISSDGVSLSGPASFGLDRATISSCGGNGLFLRGVAWGTASGVTVTNCGQNGLAVYDRAAADCSMARISANGQNGVALQGAALVDLSYAEIKNNNQCGVAGQGAIRALLTSATVTGNSGGLYLQMGGSVSAVVAKINNNKAPAFHDIRILGDGFVDFTGGEASAVLSPAANTLGNGRGYINR